ncbi:MAG: hypothetical protein JSR55_11735 [Proteobacteria bacterium]|nr:hypothetical protein [Pseudomonadota bacterium]
MEQKHKRDADGQTHSKPGSVDQQSEDSFPASDTPSFSPGAIGAPEDRKTGQPGAQEIKAAEKKVKSGAAKVPHTY